MNGFPPPPESLVTLANWRKPPFNRWAFNHVRELIPSAGVRRNLSPGPALEKAPRELSDFKVVEKGRSLDLRTWLAETHTDSMVVLKGGKLAFEYYAPGQDAETPHIWMSVSKSVLGLIAGILVGRGQLKLDDPIAKVIPELKHSAFAAATVRDALDMRVGVKFDEDYHATEGAIIAYRKSHLWDPIPVGEAPTDMRTFFSTFRDRDGEHSDRFHYVSPNTDLLGWVLERVSGLRFADLISETLWKPLQAEGEAYITVDRFGAPRCAGGFCAVPRDMARVARLFVTGGSNGNVQVVPSDWIDDIINKGDADAWRRGDFNELFDGAPMHYRSKWYVLRGDRPLIYGVGVFGQNVFVDPAADLVIAKCSSQPLPLDKGFIQTTLAGVEVLRRIFA
jgi:CubicO group peptidase (beta-lactamase class C family)